MKSCWKINAAMTNRSCRTDHLYFYDRLTGKGGSKRETQNITNGAHNSWSQGMDGDWERMGKVGFSIHKLGVKTVWEADVFG